MYSSYFMLSELILEGSPHEFFHLTSFSPIHSLSITTTRIFSTEILSEFDDVLSLFYGFI